MLKMNNSFLKLTKNVFFLLVLSLSSQTYSQKTMEKSWDASTVYGLQIESDAVFLISITTAASETIELTTKVVGENSENLLVRSKIIDGVLQISTGFNPYFENHNDKLAAHKVLSIEMEFKIPENKNIHISSLIASVIAQGSFKNFVVNLISGNCTLTSFHGNANLKTKRGSITVTTQKEAIGNGVSTYGNVQNSLLNRKGANVISAKSIYGDIVLKQTQ